MRSGAGSAAGVYKMWMWGEGSLRGLVNASCAHHHPFPPITHLFIPPSLLPNTALQLLRYANRFRLDEPTAAALLSSSAALSLTAAPLALAAAAASVALGTLRPLTLTALALAAAGSVAAAAAAAAARAVVRRRAEKPPSTKRDTVRMVFRRRGGSSVGGPESATRAPAPGAPTAAAGGAVPTVAQEGFAAGSSDDGALNDPAGEVREGGAQPAQQGAAAPLLPGGERDAPSIAPAKRRWAFTDVDVPESSRRSASGGEGGVQPPQAVRQQQRARLHWQTPAVKRAGYGNSLLLRPGDWGIAVVRKHAVPSRRGGTYALSRMPMPA
jgi:hypothetical protein